MFRSAYLNINPEAILENLRLDFDNGKWVPLDMDYAQFWQVFRSWFPKSCVNSYYAVFAHGDSFDTRLLKMNHFSAAQLGGDSLLTTVTTGRRNMTTLSCFGSQNTLTSTTIGAWIRTEGFGPHQTMYIPMKQLTDGTVEVIPTTEYSRIDLKTTKGSGSGENGSEHLVAEYLKPNGM